MSEINLFKVYKNIITCSTDKKYRGLQLLKPEITDEKEFNNQINMHNYVRIDCTSTVWYLMHNDGKLADIKSDTEKVIKSVKNIKELNVISNNIFKPSSKLNFKENDKFKKANVLVSFYHISLFVTDIGRHDLVPEKYTILSEDDSNKVLLEMRVSWENLQKIFSSDPQMVWLGAKSGHIVRIVDTHNLSGECVMYKAVY